MINEVILFIMIILDCFGAVYVYQLLSRYINKRIAEKKQANILKSSQDSSKTASEKFKTTISDDFKLESIVLCDEVLEMLDAYK